MRSAEQTPWLGLQPVKAGVVKIGDRDYGIWEQHPCSANQGLRLWPASVMLARELDRRKLKGTVCEVGPGGHGLPGMVAADKADVSFLERDAIVSERLEVCCARNKVAATFCCSDWADPTLPTFDTIVGSEVIYSGHHLGGLAAFLAKHWTGKGPCLIANSGRQAVEEFGRGLRSVGLRTEWSELGGVHADGRAFTVDLWHVRR